MKFWADHFVPMWFWEMLQSRLPKWERCVPLSVCRRVQGEFRRCPASAASTRLIPITTLKFHKSKSEHFNQQQKKYTRDALCWGEEKKKKKRDATHRLRFWVGALQARQWREHVCLGRLRLVRMFLLRDFEKRRHAEETQETIWYGIWDQFKNKCVFLQKKKKVFYWFFLLNLQRWWSN